jgi:hypothetical protein
MEVSYSCFWGEIRNNQIAAVGAVEKLEIPPSLRDFRAQWESPDFGLFHGAGFSTALLPTNSAIEPVKKTVKKGTRKAARKVKQGAEKVEQKTE